MIIFYPISILFGFFVNIRQIFYKIGLLRSYKVKTKVISVGNLTFGGTGKTPSVDFLLEVLKANKKIAVISRGYGRCSSGFLKVNPKDINAANVYGDEPTLLGLKHPEVSVYVCEDRVSGCRQIENSSDVDMIIADDAFQHLRLKRDIDIVVIDATEKFINYNYPPVGRARNSFCFLDRADFIFLTKTNLCSAVELDRIRNKIKNYSVIEFESQVEGFYDLKNDKIPTAPPKEVYLVSGIGKPKTFESLINKNFPQVIIRGHAIFKDHYDYTESDISKIKAQSAGVTILTTEKDAVKLARFSSELDFCVTKLKFSSRSNVSSLLKELNK